MFTGVSVADCRFDTANCKGWSLWGCRVEDTSFEDAVLADAAMAGWHHRRPKKYANEWRRVDFRRADLRGTSHSHELYEDCDFTDARLDDVDFDGSRHVRSRFAGILRDVIFSRRPLGRRHGEPNPMKDVDLTDATLMDVEFRGLDLLSTRLPQSPDHVTYRPRSAVAVQVLRMIEERRLDLADLRVIARLDIERGPRGDAIGIVHVSELGADETERASAVALLREAEEVVAGCRAPFGANY